MHPQAVVFILREVHPIQEFQIVQEEVDRLSIRIVPDTGFTEAVRQAILKRVAQVMGPAGAGRGRIDRDDRPGRCPGSTDSSSRRLPTSTWRVPSRLRV